MPVIGSSGGIGLASLVYPMDMPNGPANALIEVGMHDNVSAGTSPFTKSQQVQDWLAEYLTLHCELPPMDKDYARAWCGFLAALHGISGSFYAGDSSGPRPRGSAAGTPVVDGDGQRWRRLAARGFPPDSKLVMRTGDWIQLGTTAAKTARLYMNLLDVDSDNSGRVTLDIYPRLRLAADGTGPADGEFVYTAFCKGPFRLTSNDRSYKVDSAMKYGIVFDAREVL